MKRTQIVLTLCAVLAATNVHAQDKILIGDISSMSGPLAVGGVPGRQGTVLAVEQINKSGGVLGRQIELLTRDDKTLPEEAGRVFRELNAQGVLVAMGTTGSGTSKAMNAMARELKMPFFTNLGYSRFLTEESGHRYFFRLITNDRVLGHGMAELMSEQPPKTYCTVGLDYAYGRDITKVFMEHLTKLKPSAKLVSGCEFWVPFGTTDFTPILTVMLSRRPDAVMFGGLVAASAPAFAKQGKAFGLFKRSVGVHPSIGMPLNNAGLTRKEDIPENIYTGTDYPFPPMDNAASKAFFEAYKKRWNQVPFEVSMNAYVAMHFIAKAIEKAGKVDREAFIDAAEGLSIDHPIMGKVTLREFDHQSDAGWWFGFFNWDATNNRPGMRDLKLTKSDSYLPSKAEIEKMRSK